MRRLKPERNPGPQHHTPKTGERETVRGDPRAVTLKCVDAALPRAPGGHHMGKDPGYQLVKKRALPAGLRYDVIYTCIHHQVKAQTLGYITIAPSPIIILCKKLLCEPTVHLNKAPFEHQIDFL